MTQLKIPAVYIYGGSSKSVFFRADALPADPVQRPVIDWFLAIAGIRRRPSGHSGSAKV